MPREAQLLSHRLGRGFFETPAEEQLIVGFPTADGLTNANELQVDD